MPGQLDDVLNAFADQPDTLAATQARPSYGPVAPAFETSLSAQEEQAFRQWKGRYAPRDSGADYDLRGAFKAGLMPDAQTGHWPDTYKKPNHPTFSDQSIYASLTGTKPGTWQGETYRPMEGPHQVDDVLNAFQDDQRDQLNQTVNLGTGQDPARSTKVLQLFGKTGLPRDFIERNTDFVDQEASKQDFNPAQLMKDSPAFASWLAEHPDHVAAAKPDVQALSYIERQFRYIGLNAESGVLQKELGGLGGKAFHGTITPQERARQAEIESRLQDIDSLGRHTDISGLVEQVPGQVVQQLPNLLQTLSGALKEGAKGLVEGAGLGAIAGAPGGAPGSLAGAATGGTIGASYGAMTGFVVEAGKMEMHHAYLDYEKLRDEQGQPLDPTTIRGLAVMTGSLNGLIEGLFGTERLGVKIPGLKSFTRDGIKDLLKTPTARAAILGYAKTIGATIGIEGATEYTQEVITSAGGVLAKALKDGGSPTKVIGDVFSPDNLDRYAQAARSGAQAGGGMATVLTAPQLAQDLGKVRAANQAKQAFESIGDATAKAKFAQDLPGPLRDIIERATKDGPVETLYVPAHAFNEYFQKEGVDPREVYQEVTGDVEAYDQAVETGADLPISTADYAQKLAGTKHNAFFANELRTSLDAMNGFEAQEWIKNQDEIDKAAAEQTGTQTGTVSNTADAVRQDIAGQLQGLGFDPTVVDQYASLFASRYGARAERRGLGETAADLFRQQNLTVTRPIPAVLQQLGNTTELDALLNRLRTGDVPKQEEIFGQSLMTFLKAKGGLQDQGGELAARNVDQGRKPFTKKLVQQSGLTLDEAAQRAVEAGYLDERDIGKLLEAIDQEARGTPVFAVGQESARGFDVQQNLDSLKAYLDAQGIDLATATNAQIKQKLGEAVQQPLPGQEGQTFAQTFNEGGTPKASITFAPGNVNIKLFEKADLSSFLHEGAHLFFNELLDDAKAIEAIAPEARTPVQLQLLTDLATVHQWLGNKDDAKRITTAQHEQFARGFESYLMEGRSPSQAMREVFATFRRWMISVYRSLTTAPLNVKLTKPVREVFDRLIATDLAIDQAAQEADVHPLFLDAESAGMTPTQFEAYRKTVQDASLTARETLQKQLMGQYQRQSEKWWKDEREVLRGQILDRVNQQSEYVALSVLTTGTMPDGSAMPDGIEPMKLDRKSIAAQFGQDFLKRVPRGTMSKNGMHPDAAAPIFGFNSGQELVMAIVNARPKNQLIDAEADQQMQDRHGDMRFDGTIAEAAKAAVLNDHQEQVIAAEIRALNAKQREVAPFVKAAAKEADAKKQEGRKLLKTVIPTLKDTRELARNILQRTTLKQLNPFAYSVAARQASKRATEALAAQDYLDAGLHKQRELLNLALFREATIIKQQIEKAHELAKDFGKADSTLTKSRNVDLINVGRAILAQYGLARPVEKTAAEYLAPIKTYDTDLYNQWKPQVDALAPRPLDYNALTVGEFTKLFDDLQALWLLSRRTKQTLINGQLEDRANVVDLLSSVIAGYTPAQRDAVVGPQTAWAETKMGLMSWVSALTRVESWVDGMDAGNPNGLFRRYIWTPISEATDAFKGAKADALTKYLALIRPIEATMTHELIPAPELGPGVSFRGRQSLLHAILHTGNESNQSKLLRGYHWDANGWQRFLDRAIRDKIVTKADYDYAQGVWDLLESIKPLAQKAHHEMYGYYFNEITAKELDTPFGTYKGGYVPAIADRAQSVDQAIREEKDLFEQGGNSFMFPTTGRGFTKGRIEEYAAPLALDLRTIPAHLDKVLRFVHLEPRVKDAARIITNKTFRTALDGMNSTVAKDMLVPWLQRAAQQQVSSPGKNRGADRLWRYLRNTVGAQIMVGNVLNTLQQFTGFPIALTKVKAKYLRGAMARYVFHPSQYAEDVYTKSAFMKHELHTQVIEIQQGIDEILLNPTKYDKAKDFMQKHGYILQQATQNIVSLTTWGGAYDQAINDGADEREAVRTADSTVRLTQGSFSPVNISAFESGTPFVRAFTMFYSYFNMQANLLKTEFGKIATQQMGLRKGAGRAFYIYLMGFAAPAILSEAIVKGIGGFDPDDDEDYLNELFSLLFGSQIRSALAFFPGVGPVSLAAINAFNDKWFDDRISTSPVVSVMESAARAPHSVYQAISEDGHSKRAIRDVLTLIGLLTGTPAASLARPLGYLGDVADGVAQPEDAGDVARGLISGRDVNRSK